MSELCQFNGQCLSHRAKPENHEMRNFGRLLGSVRPKLMDDEPRGGCMRNVEYVDLRMRRVVQDRAIGPQGGCQIDISDMHIPS